MNQGVSALARISLLIFSFVAELETRRVAGEGVSDVSTASPAFVLVVATSTKISVGARGNTA